MIGSLRRYDRSHGEKIDVHPTALTYSKNMSYNIHIFAKIATSQILKKRQMFYSAIFTGFHVPNISLNLCCLKVTIYDQIKMSI